MNKVEITEERYKELLHHEAFSLDVWGFIKWGSERVETYDDDGGSEPVETHYKLDDDALSGIINAYHEFENNWKD